MHDAPQAEWLAELLSDSRAVVQALLAEPRAGLDALRQQVQSYQIEIDAAGPTADQELGALLAERSLKLLDRVAHSTDPTAHHLAQVAVRYFVLDDDGDDDLMSPFGFDDDVEVFNAVVQQLGHRDLLIDYDG